MARNLRKPESATASDVELKWQMLKLAFGAKPPGEPGGFVLVELGDGKKGCC